MLVMTRKQKQCAHDQALIASTQRVQQEPFFTQDGQMSYQNTPLLTTELSERKLYRWYRCYICKEKFNVLHEFYHTLCPTCAPYNYQQRFASADLKQRIALVTGGRIKIGFEIALKLLRAGAIVHITTRFKQDAAWRYAQQPDFAVWSHRLMIHELDLRHLSSVEIFCRYLHEQLPYLDILINNAAQTIRKTNDYWLSMWQREQLLQACVDQRLLRGFVDPVWKKTQQHLLTHATAQPVPLDEFAEPVDFQAQNSWMLSLGECSTQEMLEVQLINVMAPFLFNSQLKPLLLRSPQQQRFVINVSAMEGQFNRTNKTHRHPHTNMAKAALNMMTRTAAMDYARDHIYMNSVDTGWVTQEKPLPYKVKDREQGIVPPLDCLDGAARVLAPIWDAVNGAEPVFGLFLKDYHPTVW